HVAMPTADYDDVADVVDAALGKRPGRWSPTAARTCALAATGVLAVAGALVLARVGPPWTVPGLGAALAGAMLIGAAGAVSRALADGTAGTVVPIAAVPYAFLAGAALFAGPVPAASFGPGELMTGCAAVVVTATLGLAWVGDGTPPLLATLVLALSGIL